jgi:spermidine/putrescine transport system substrate-binding protein
VAVLLGFTMAATAVLSGCGTSKTEELNLYTWADMFPQEVLDGFEEETGIKINYTNFDYDEDMLAKLEETNGGEYDFVIADDYILELIEQEGLAQDLDKSKLENYGNINPIYQGQFYDEDDSFTIPYGAGSPLIVYDPAQVDIDITGYADLWDPSLEDSVAIIGNYRVIDGITLKAMGESFNVEDLDVIRAAGDKLLELAPNIRAIEDNNTQDLLISGEVTAAFMYTSQVYMALNARDDLEVVYPKEGLGFGIMAGFIPSDAPNADAAYAFIDYLLRPEISAECFTYIGYFCTNKAAEEYIDESVRAVLVPSEDALKGEFIENISQEADDLHAEIWNNFKNACD